MTTTRRVATMLVLAALAAPVTGCAVYGRPRLGVVYISREPPVERVEVVPATPGPGYVWIRGYWGWQGSDFAWVSGRWERPVEGRHEWVADHWEHDSHGWFHVEGHWR
jgi:hypothetical protein